MPVTHCTWDDDGQPSDVLSVGDRRYVAVDALLTADAAFAYSQGYDKAPLVPWDEDAPADAQDFSMEIAGLRAVVTYVEGRERA